MSSAQLGWNLIRGSAKEWGADKALLEVEEINQKVDKLGNAWQSFQIERANVLQINPLATHWRTALRLLEARQLNLLDATRAAHMIGRPMAGGVLLRTIYENFLAILLIAFGEDESQTEDIAASGRSKLNKEQLAKRFLDQGQISLLLSIDRHYKTNGETVLDGLIDPDALESTLNELRPQFIENKRFVAWHKFRSTRKLFEHIWHESGAPIFPNDLFPFCFTTWKSLYDANFDDRHNDVHSDAASIYIHEMAMLKNGKALITRNWRPDEFDSSLQLVEFSIRAIASAEGVFELYKAKLTEHEFVAHF